MSPRTDLVSRLAAMVGPALEIESLASGWPSLAVLHSEAGDQSLALFVGSIGLSQRGRDAVERRFQNPSSGSPLMSVPGRASVLLGVWERDDHVNVERPIIALLDADRREGHRTRWSAFLPLLNLSEAVEAGWSSNVSASGEAIYYFVPSLLPVALMSEVAGAEPNEGSIYRAISALGLRGLDLSEDDPERLRRTVSSLVRDSRFSGAVLRAYGRRCAMCGLGLGIVQGAHIYPASAPGSRDEVSNGIALCANHHLAFDRHIIAVEPDTLVVRFHPSVLEAARLDAAVRNFTGGTGATLSAPVEGLAPDPNAFVRRYEYFKAEYSWLGTKAN